MRRQCELLGLARSSMYYEAVPESEENLRFMRMIDEYYLDHPEYGSRRMAAWLRTLGHAVSRKRAQRLMRLMGLQAIYPKPRLSQPGEGQIYPYLLRNLEISRADQVWSTDITYVPLKRGFLYLAAVIDWHSRYVLGWRLSNTLDGSFCEELLDATLSGSRRPEIFNTDQGSQFTSHSFTGRLKAAGIKISMDGKGRALDNVFIERLWRSVKHEHLYRWSFEDGEAVHASLEKYFAFYNNERVHQSLGYARPRDVYRPQE